MKNKITELTREKMAAVVQIYAVGYAGEDIKCILNPRLGDLKEWSGSGFFIDTKYGEDIIITNAHVTRNAKSLEIMTMLSSEETFQVELVTHVKNLEPDIAILRLKKGELKRLKSIAKREIPHLKLKKTNNISRGTELKAIGYPMGMTEPNVTGGEITNFISGNRVISEKYVTDAAINPGNSGGPAIDENGSIIGINTSIYQDAENIGFITPYTFIDILLKNFFEKDSICLSDLGGDFQKNSSTIATKLKMDSTNGMIVNTIDSEGFLNLLGVKEEDVILSLNGEEIDRHGIFISEEYYHRRNIFDAIKLIPIGTDVNVTVWRNGQKLDLRAKTHPLQKNRIASKPIITERIFLNIWGMLIQPLSYEILEAFNLLDTQVFYQLIKHYDDKKERLIVTHIEKESQAYMQEWSVGETIAKVNGCSIEGLDHLVSILNDGSEEYKFKSEYGAIGYFKHKNNKKEIKLLNPADFLK